MKKMMLYFLAIWLVFGFIQTNAIAEEQEENTYKSFVDQYYGFYRIISLDTNVTPIYDNKTLEINVGDTIIWINDADPDEPLTILSEQLLWGNRSAYLRWNYQRFNYTFSEPGEYSVYIKEYPRLKQRIIVHGLTPVLQSISEIITPTITMITPTITPVISREKSRFSAFVLISLMVLMVLTIYILLRLRRYKK